MALAQKPRKTTATRKAQAAHHQHSKHYLKAYWPYLPMLAIVSGGVALNRDVAGQDSLGLLSFNSNTALLRGQETTLANLWTGSQASWLTISITLAALLVAVLFLFQHSYRLHRFLNHGEEFIAKHPWLDVISVAIFTVGFVLTRRISL